MAKIRRSRAEDQRLASIPKSRVIDDHPADTQARGIAANSGRGKPYTIPVLQFPSGELVMDSDIIAKRLEAFCPTPSLALDDPILGKVEQAVKEVLLSLLPVLILPSRDMLDGDGWKWFERDRSQALGMSCDEFAEACGGETAWTNAESGLSSLKDVLTSHKTDDGPFIRGKDVTYGDFVIASFFEWTRRVGDGEVYQRIVRGDKAFLELQEACGPWLSKDD
jgi:glutathione S-transferase